MAKEFGFIRYVSIDVFPPNLVCFCRWLGDVGEDRNCRRDRASRYKTHSAVVFDVFGQVRELFAVFIDCDGLCAEGGTNNNISAV